MKVIPEQLVETTKKTYSTLQEAVTATDDELQADPTNFSLQILLHANLKAACEIYEAAAELGVTLGPTRTNEPIR